MIVWEARVVTNERLTAALQVVVNVARCIALKRALAAADPDPSLNFWRVIHGNLLDVRPCPRALGPIPASPAR